MSVNSYKKQVGRRRQRELAIIIPAYNEEKRLGKVIDSIPSTIKSKGAPFNVTVIVVDDCSTDDTYAVAAAKSDVVIRHVFNSGAGAATRTGLHYALTKIRTLAYAATIDADGQHVPRDIEKILTYAEKESIQLVVGSRLHGGNNKSMPRYRIYGNKGLSFISRMLFGISVKDTQSGLRLIAVSALPLVSDYSIDRYGFCTEMLWLAKKHAVTMAEVPIAVTYSAESLRKGQSNWGAVDLLRDLILLRISR